MQLIPRYLYINQILLTANDSGFVVEYRPVYTRTIKVYKGIDNTIQFRLVNADQKPVRISGTPVIVIFDEEKTKILEKNCTVLDDASSTATKGLFEFTFTENDLLNIKQQYLNYNVYFEQADGTRNLTYSNRNFDSSGTIYLDGNAYPGPKASVSIKNFQTVGNEWHAGSDDTDRIEAYPGLNGNEGLHTVAIYTNNYVGSVKIEATLDNQLDTPNNWSTVDTVVFSGTETEPVARNLTGVYRYIRFVATADPANSITQILVRN